MNQSFVHDRNLVSSLQVRCRLLLVLLLLPCSPEALRNPGHDSCKWKLSSYRVNYRPDDFHSAKRTRDEPVRPERLPYFNERVVERFRKMKLGLGLDLRLKQHQQDGVVLILRHICSQSPCGCIVADSMGLGKTIQALAAAFFMFRAFDLRTVLPNPSQSSGAGKQCDGSQMLLG